jgi:glycosyltransferase involved in cell wall biosynthesis
MLITQRSETSAVGTRVAEQRLRVCYITSGGTASRGGMGRMAFYLTEEYRRHHPSLDVRVLDSYGSGFGVMPFYFIKCFVSLALTCVFKRPDVVHLNLAAHGSAVRKLSLMWLVRGFRIPTVLHIHASQFIPFCESLGPRLRRLLVGSLSRASRVVVIGEYWRRYVVETLGVPGEIVTVIHNAVPLPELRSAARAANKRCRIVALGLLGVRKGTPELLEALAGPALRGLDWEAVIAGNGEVEASRQRAAALGLLDRVQIPGWVDAEGVAALLSSADVFVLPSHNEGLPVSILEAMGNGLPIVTTPVGAIPELVIPDENGLLVPPGSALDLGEALAKLVRDPELRARQGASGRARVEQHFRIEPTVERFVGIYRAVTRDERAVK